MTTSAIFTAGVYEIKLHAISALFSGPVLVLREQALSAIFTNNAFAFVVQINPNYVDSITGQAVVVSPGDILTDTSGNQLGALSKKILSMVTGIDATATGVTALYTVPANMIVLVTEAVVKVSSSSGITVPATAGIGVAGGEDDIIPSNELVNLIDINRQYNLDVSGVAAVAAAGEVINFGIDIAATGTSQTLQVCLLGIQISV